LKTTAGNSIVIAPIGDFDPQLLTEVGSQIHRVFRCAPQVGPILADVAFAFDTGREQYHSTPILQRLAEAAPPGALKVLALTDVDLFIPILTHVYGEAQLGGIACIVSTYRLNSGAGTRHFTETGARRVVKEAIHELGHTFKLRHCPDAACIMHYCRSEADVDRKSNDLCRYCRVMLNDELKQIIRMVRNAGG
jgi:archaemetzincin